MLSTPVAECLECVSARRSLLKDIALIVELVAMCYVSSIRHPSHHPIYIHILKGDSGNTPSLRVCVKPLFDVEQQVALSIEKTLIYMLYDATYIRIRKCFGLFKFLLQQLIKRDS